MLIGEDFDKIQFSFFGLDLVEPNAFIGDCFILAIALFLAFKTRKLNTTIPFFKNWNYFFITFGIGMFFGGLGHLMFNQWGFYGKYIPWYIGLLAVFFIERAMISLQTNKKTKSILTKLGFAKLVIAIIAETAVFIFADMSIDHSVGLRVPAINSAIGLIFSLGVLGYIYKRTITPGFKYLFYSIFIMLPSALFIAFKINIHQWFDKNDFGHLLLIVAMIFYFQSIKAYAKHVKEQA